MENKKLYDVPEFKAVVPMSTAGIYKAMSEGKIPFVAVGRRKFIPSWYVERLMAEPSAVAQ